MVRTPPLCHFENCNGEIKVACLLHVYSIDLECITSPEKFLMHPQNHRYFFCKCSHKIYPYKNGPHLCLEKVKCTHLWVSALPTLSLLLAPATEVIMWLSLTTCHRTSNSRYTRTPSSSTYSFPFGHPLQPIWLEPRVSTNLRYFPSL